jgi:hypothetical protein
MKTLDGGCSNDSTTPKRALGCYCAMSKTKYKINDASKTKTTKTTSNITMTGTKNANYSNSKDNNGDRMTAKRSHQINLTLNAIAVKLLSYKFIPILILNPILIHILILIHSISPHLPFQLFLPPIISSL